MQIWLRELKKLLKEDITTPVQFFYDSEFDYGDKDPKTGNAIKVPIMFIGEVPSAWKKWMKLPEIKAKTSKTFAAGRCVFDSATGTLSLEVKMGKGAKAPVLKAIHKELLKPFAKPVFVEVIGSAPIAEDADATVTEDTTAFDIDISDYTKELDELLAEGEPMIPVLEDINTNVYEAFIKGNNLRTVSEEMIHLFSTTMNKIRANQYEDCSERAKALLTQFDNDTELDTLIKAGGGDAAKLQAYQDARAKLVKFGTDVDTLHPNIEKVIETAISVQQVSAPTEGEFPPVSTNPLEHLTTQLQLQSKHSGQEIIQGGADLMKEVNKHN